MSHPVRVPMLPFLVGPADAAARRGADLDRRGRSGRRGGVGRGRCVDGHGGVERRRVDVKAPGIIPTGRNTATIEKVVATTASPI